MNSTSKIYSATIKSKNWTDVQRIYKIKDEKQLTIDNKRLYLKIFHRSHSFTVLLNTCHRPGWRNCEDSLGIPVQRIQTTTKFQSNIDRTMSILCWLLYSPEVAKPTRNRRQPVEPESRVARLRAGEPLSPCVPSRMYKLWISPWRRGSCAQEIQATNGQKALASSRPAAARAKPSQR